MHITFFRRCLLIFFVCIIAGNLHAQIGISSCGTADSTVAHYLIKHSQKVDLSKARMAAGEKLEYRLALDINYATYLRYNKDIEWIKRVAYKFIDDASQIFEREINVKLTVSAILIWDKPEPYQLVGDLDYFYNVQNYWSQNRTDRYDALVGMSVRYGWFYGGYRMCTSNFPEPNNPLLAVDLLSHELGHTLGSPHTHNCSWPGGPIDYCERLEGCSGNYTEYVNGTLMSYCRSMLTFHPLCRNLMRDYADGKVNSSFKLNALNTVLPAPGSLVLKDPTAQAASNTPSFEWNAPAAMENFQFQIGRNADFTDLAEDTLINQSYFQSSGLAEGSYYARFKSINTVGSSIWSASRSFSIPAFSENSSAPVLLQTVLSNDGTVSGYFKKYSGTDVYQVEITDEDNRQQSFVYQINMASSVTQSFSVPLNMHKRGRYSARIRVGKEQRWSKWSVARNLEAAFDNELWKLTNLSKVSDNPVLAVTLYKAALASTALTQIMEIATDSLFKQVSVRDSVASYQINDWRGNKAVFNPQLEENKSYFFRTRVKYGVGLYSKWNSYTLSTGSKDRRFQFLGVAGKNLQSTNMTFGEYQTNKLYNTGTELYVQALFSGYYVTTDLKNWQVFTTSTTQARIPNFSPIFGVSDDEKVYLYDQKRALVINSKEGATEYINHSEDYLSVYGLTPVSILKNDGMMFKTDNKGIAHIRNGRWEFYAENTFGTQRSMYLAADSKGQVWNVQEGGSVWSYKNSGWTREPFFANWRELKGIGFDSMDVCYLYGDFGVAKLNDSRNWEIIPALRGIPVRKIVFDKMGQMWLASYRHNGDVYLSYALIKLKGQKISVYSDGLNFLKEPFDIEVFKDKLVILTSGGEIHTFDETLIQSFKPAVNYCSGGELSLSLNTNSTFAADNEISVTLIDNTSGKIRSITDVSRDGNAIKAVLPVDMNSGTYKMTLVTTNPEIQSPVEGLLNISVPVRASIKQEQGNAYTTRLIASGGDDLTYKWHLNGVEIASENSALLNVYESGDYAVEITTKNGCRSMSDATKVKIDEPAEIILLQNAPNPVNTTSEIAFYLTQTESVSLDLYNTRGQYLRTLKVGTMQKGWHKYVFDDGTLPSGIYLYRLTVGAYKKALKMVKI
jgi:hypothetical protein